VRESRPRVGVWGGGAPHLVAGSGEGAIVEYTKQFSSYLFSSHSASKILFIYIEMQKFCLFILKCQWAN